MENLLPAVLRHLEALVAFDTRNPPRNLDAGGIFAYMQNALAPVGFHTAITDLGNGCVNLLATRGAAPKLLCNYHVDTVPAAQGWSRDPLELHVGDDRATGLGACDIKGAAACMLAAAEHTNGEVALLFSSDEEAGNSRCVKQFLSRGDSFAATLVAEPTMSKAVTAHRGILTCRGTFSGTAGHSSERRALQDSALHEAVRWSRAALALAQQHETTTYGPLSGVRFNLGQLEGGIKPNMIATEAKVWWGARPLPGQDAQALLTQFQACATDASRVVWQPSFQGPSLGGQGKEVAQNLGIPLGPPVHFWTEASLFAAAGHRAVVYGPGDIAQAHTADEWVALSQLANVAQTYLQILTTS